MAERRRNKKGDRFPRVRTAACRNRSRAPEWQGVDTFPPEKRSDIMRQVHCRDTSPEIAVRRLVHGLGYRYRLHAADLPGSPDLAFPARRAVIFIHGCYWHRHGCARATTPSSHVEYWERKFARNVARDRRNASRLRREGWRVAIVWECQIRDRERLARRLARFLG
jgi:DNA mismatch endonuclease (patch repair protein)